LRDEIQHALQDLESGKSHFKVWHERGLNAKE
jgi:hypothetical protein